MDAKIDYLSWTTPVNMPRVDTAGEVKAICLDTVARLHPIFTAWCESCLGWQDAGGRGHYSASTYNTRNYTSIRYGGSANHVLCEMPGTACQEARDAGHLSDILEAASARLTRIDIAVDIIDDIDPRRFVLAGYNERFRSYAEIVSAEGSTEYVGSMKSDRFARVYQYAAPHPRAGVMRVEFVLRREYAKAAATLLAGGSTPLLACTLGNTWGWKSAAWRPDEVTDGKLKAQRADRHEPGRLRWLFQVVMPALVKADADGLIDLTEFCARALQLRRPH